MASEQKENLKEKSWLYKLAHAFTGEMNEQEDLLEMLQRLKQNNKFDPETLKMLEGVLEFNSCQVRDVMIPRSQMVVIEKNENIDVFLTRLIESGHSRFPVVGDDKDDIIGILLAKDLLTFALAKNAKPFCLKDHLRQALFVPESKRLSALLNELKAKRHHMAIVVDEYGGVSGLVTIEDAIEEIVGEIEDEYDNNQDSPQIIIIRPHEYSVAALTTIDEFNKFFKTKFSDNEYDTIGGYVTHAFGHLPKKNEKIEIDKLSFTITRAHRRKIVTLQVTNSLENNP